jgi:hypothetical protein
LSLNLTSIHYFVSTLVFRAEKLVLRKCNFTLEQFKEAFHRCKVNGSPAIDKAVMKMKVRYVNFLVFNCQFHITHVKWKNNFSIDLKSMITGESSTSVIHGQEIESETLKNKVMIETLTCFHPTSFSSG